jgi:hypothetical protein
MATMFPEFNIELPAPGSTGLVRQMKMASGDERDLVLEESGKCEYNCEFLML